MKALTSILMLCLPMAAMGETFFCTSSYGAVIDEVGLIAQGNQGMHSWLVDTRLGVKVPDNDGVTQDYFGKCEVSRTEAVYVFCSAREIPFSHSIEVNKLTTGEIVFVASRYLVSTNASYSGKCTEI